MSSSIVWNESDDEYTEQESETVSLSTGLYSTTCTECGDGLGWRLDPDPDSPGWSAECCGYWYGMSVESVSIVQSDASL